MKKHSLIFLASMVLLNSPNAWASDLNELSPVLDLKIADSSNLHNVVKLVDSSHNALPINQQTALRFDYTEIDSDMTNPDEYLNEEMQFRLKLTSHF